MRVGSHSKLLNGQLLIIIDDKGKHGYRIGTVVEVVATCTGLFCQVVEKDTHSKVFRFVRASDVALYSFMQYKTQKFLSN